MAAFPAAADCLFPYWTPLSSTAGDATYVAAGDLNGDGRPDLIGARNSAIVVSMNGNGALQTAATVITGSFGSNIVAAELTGEGGLDLAAVSTAPGAALYVLPGNSDGTFRPPVVTPLTGSFVRLVAADFSGDGRTDLALLSADAGKIQVLHAGTAGSFTAGAELTTHAAPTAIAAGDLDGDGAQDLVSGSTGALSEDVFYGNGDGTFDPVVHQPSLTGANALAIRDMTADGRKDIVVLAEDGTLAVLRNEGGRSFGDPLGRAADARGTIAVVDVTGDDIPDVVHIVATALVSYRGSGTGTLGAGRLWSEEIYYPPRSWVDGAAADFDGDGRIDVAVAESGQTKLLRVIRNLCGSTMMAVTSPPLVTAGEPIDLQVQVYPPYGPKPGLDVTGDVTVRDGDTVLARGTLAAYDVKLTIPSLPLGHHELVVRYEGDAQHEPNPYPIVIDAIAEHTDVAITTSADSVEYGYRPIITAQATSSIAGALTGSYAFEINGHSEPGSGSTIQPFMYVGSNTIRAYYMGDATHPPGRSPSITVNVSRGIPFLYLTPVKSAPGGSVTLRAWAERKSDAYYAGYPPTGTVSVEEAGTEIGRGTVGNSSDVAIPVSSLSPGRHLFRIVYWGDLQYAPTEEYVPHFVTDSSAADFEARGTAEKIRVTSSIYGSIFRKRAGSNWASVRYGNYWDDRTAEAGAVYLYCSSSAGAAPIDVGMRVSFSDDILLAGAPIRGIHLTQIIAATNLLRRAAGLSEMMLEILPGTAVEASHVQTLRTAINEARTALGAYAFTFTGTIASGVRIRAAHLQELREAVR